MGQKDLIIYSLMWFDAPGCQLRLEENADLLIDLLPDSRNGFYLASLDLESPRCGLLMWFHWTMYTGNLLYLPSVASAICLLANIETFLLRRKRSILGWFQVKLLSTSQCLWQTFVTCCFVQNVRNICKWILNVGLLGKPAVCLFL